MASGAGTRTLKLRGGMPLYKYVANRLLTLWQNLFTGAKLSEYHTGYRAFIGDGQCAVAEFCRALYQFGCMRCAFQKTEITEAEQFCVIRQ